LRDWVHRFNRAGPDGLIDNWTSSPTPRLSADQLAELTAIVETGPERKVDGVVRWRRINLKRIIRERLGSTITSAMSESFSRSSAFPTSARGLATPPKTNKSSRLSKKLPARPERSSRRPAGDDAHRDLVPEPALGLDPGDEARIGQKNGRVRQWARRGTRPRQPADQRYESAYLFGAICPARGVGAALALPFADTEAMQLHLDEISRHVAEGAHAVLLLDRAGWHTTAKLDLPSNITPIFLPSRAPELNPQENIWQFMRGNWLSKTWSSKPTTRSSTPPATPGESSSTSQKRSYPSACEIGPMGG
jgi:hypothetical protein